MMQEFKTTASLQTLKAKLLLDYWKNLLQEHSDPERQLETPDEQTLIAHSPFGTMTIVQNTTENITFQIVCNDATKLQESRDRIAHINQHFEEDQLTQDGHLPELTWSGEIAVNAFPPNFRLVQVKKVELLTPHFYRMTVQGEDLERFTQALHFKLIRSCQPSERTIWPLINEKGNTIWPQGEHALIRKTYTTRFLDLAQKELIFDIFIHEGGPTSEWAASLPIGETVGISGPGGTPPPSHQEWILMAADETALPTVMRVLESAPEGMKGHAVMLVPTPESMQEVNTKSDIQVEWIFRNKQANLAEAVKAIEIPKSTETYCWFVSYQQEAALMKQYFSDIGLKKSQVCAVGFWKKTSN